MKKYIFRASFTKDGITYYAKNYGKKAFKIRIWKAFRFSFCSFSHLPFTVYSIYTYVSILFDK